MADEAIYLADMPSAVGDRVLHIRWPWPLIHADVVAPWPRQVNAFADIGRLYAEREMVAAQSAYILLTCFLISNIE